PARRVGRHHTTGAAAHPPATAATADMTEAQLQANVLELCRWLGLLVYHTYDSRRSHRGWPDLAIVGTHLMVRELKSARGRLTVDQQRWLEALRAAGVDADVWRPEDWPSRITSELRKIAGRPG